VIQLRGPKLCAISHITQAVLFLHWGLRDVDWEVGITTERCSSNWGHETMHIQIRPIWAALFLGIDVCL